MADLTPAESKFLGDVLNSALSAEARRAARGDCPRCGHPTSAHHHQVIGRSGGRDIVAVSCPPSRRGDYHSPTDREDD